MSSIEDHIAANYDARIAAGESPQSLLLQFEREGYDDLVEWVKGRIEAVEAHDAPAPVETAVSRAPVETAVPPAKA